MSCCGDAKRARRSRAKPNRATLVANPKVKHGTDVIYLGGRALSIKGRYSGLVYHVSPQRRYVLVENKDVVPLIERGDFMLKP